MDLPPLRYLSASDVVASMPDIDTRLELAATTMVALAKDAQLPPKIGVHPPAAESFAHAMPAWMRGAAADGSEDLMGIKWVAGFPANATAGLPVIHATTILSDATTGVPRSFMDAGAVTAHRTAAVSGVVISRWGPPPGKPAGVTIIGAGVQARSHLPVISHLLPGSTLSVCDRDAGRATSLAAEIETGQHGRFERVRATTDATDAVDGADLVVTMVSFGPDRQSIPAGAFGPRTTIVTVDYDMCVPASVAREAELFLTDDLDQYLANRTETQFVGYPEPMGVIGDAILERTPRPSGRVLVSHLGAGLADVVFGDAILREAERRGIGTILER